MRLYETAGHPVLDVLVGPACGRRAGHPGRHISAASLRRRAAQAPSGSPAVAALIREARKRAGMTQRRLAAVLGVTATAVQHYEYGKRTPSEERWIQLELALGPLGVVRERPEPAATRSEAA
jgi:ribosome-binding protein aMBF1 (putative translation factor)